MWVDPVIPNLSFRTVSAADDGVIFAIVKATMSDYVRQTFGKWDDDEQRVLAKANTDYEAMRIIVRAGQDIGILTCLDKGDHLEIKQVFLNPDCQGQGLGSTILNDLKRQASKNDLPIRLRVLACNPAQHLYTRHGFVTTQTTPERIYMEFRP